jgi:hypothetical protein
MLTPGKRYVMHLEYVRENPTTGLHIFNVIGTGMQIELATIDAV